MLEGVDVLDLLKAEHVGVELEEGLGGERALVDRELVEAGGLDLPPVAHRLVWIDVVAKAPAREQVLDVEGGESDGRHGRVF